MKILIIALMLSLTSTITFASDDSCSIKITTLSCVKPDGSVEQITDWGCNVSNCSKFASETAVCGSADYSWGGQICDYTPSNCDCVPN